MTRWRAALHKRIPSNIAGRLAFALGAAGILLLAAPLPGAAPQTRRAATATPPNRVAIDASPQLFATMCALYAAGYESEVSDVGAHPVRARLRSQLLRLEGPATEALRAYYKDHQAADSIGTLSRFVSFALVAGPPPAFRYSVSHDDLPPDVLPIEGFSEVLANFYAEAHIDRRWAQVQPEYEREIARLHEPVAQIVLTSTSYLRELLKPTSPRTFAVYVEPLVGGKTNFRNFGEQYAIVLSPGNDPPLDEVRHAFLHFLLDPLARRYPKPVEARRPLLNIAARAPRLPNEYREDAAAFFTECLVRAVELRLHRLPADKLAAAVAAAEGDGFILVRPMLRELALFEKAEPAMSFYFPDLLSGIEVAEEAKRLQAMQFAAVPADEPKVGSDDPKTASREDLEIAALLTEGERQIAAKDGVAAAAAFERALAKQPDQPRALYGLAVASVLQKDASRARELFQRLVAAPPQGAKTTLPTVPDPLILAWSHVYLGRIYDVDGNRDLAVSEYRAALAVEGAPESARQAARRGMEEGYKRAGQLP